MRVYRRAKTRHIVPRFFIRFFRWCRRPSTTSPSYSTTACPGVMARWAVEHHPQPAVRRGWAVPGHTLPSGCAGSWRSSTGWAERLAADPVHMGGQQGRRRTTRVVAQQDGVVTPAVLDGVHMLPGSHAQPLPLVGGVAKSPMPPQNASVPVHEVAGRQRRTPPAAEATPVPSFQRKNAISWLSPLSAVSSPACRALSRMAGLSPVAHRRQQVRQLPLGQLIEHSSDPCDAPRPQQPVLAGRFIKDPPAHSGRWRYSRSQRPAPCPTARHEFQLPVAVDAGVGRAACAVLRHGCCP